MSIDARIKAATKRAAPSLIPEEPEKPAKEAEVLPDIREVIDDPRVIKSLSALVESQIPWILAEAEAKRERKPIIAAIKKLLKDMGDTRAMVGANRMVYFNAPRSVLNVQKLLAHGVAPKIIQACTDTVDAWTLKITPPGEEKEDI